MTTTLSALPGGATDRDRRREEIAAAACEVLAERGLAGTSIRHVAKAAGVSLGTLPHYFADKEELLLHAHRYSYEGTTRRFLARPGPRAGLRALAGLLEDGLPLDEQRRREWKVWLTFWGHAQYSSLVGENHRRRYARWRETIAALVRSAQVAGELASSLDPEREAESLVAFVDGLALQAMLEPDVYSPGRQLELLAAHLRRLSGGGPSR